jgi:putative Mg2+ transporter-C (MgtC) family protein
MHGVDIIADTQLVMLGKLALAAILGMTIGTERGLLARQAAGMRTFALVALGSCLFVVTTNHLDSAFLGVINFDPARMAAGIVQGIGFLGAGLIIFRNDSLHGITTAAGLWVAAAIGIAVGYGMYVVAIGASVLMLIVLTGLWYLEHRFSVILREMHPDTEQPLGH